MKKIRTKPVTDKDRRLLADFMEYMRTGGEIGEAIRQQQKASGSPPRYGR